MKIESEKRKETAVMKFKVRLVKYETYEVEADTQDMAIEKACEMCDRDPDAWTQPADDIEIEENKHYRYSVWYCGAIYYGDRPDTWHGINTDDFKYATQEYNYMISMGIEVEIHDNEYDVVFKNGEWS